MYSLVSLLSGIYPLLFILYVKEYSIGINQRLIWWQPCHVSMQLKTQYLINLFTNSRSSENRLKYLQCSVVQHVHPDLMEDLIWQKCASFSFKLEKGILKICLQPYTLVGPTVTRTPSCAISCQPTIYCGATLKRSFYFS